LTWKRDNRRMPGRDPAHITPLPPQAPAPARAQGWGASLWRGAPNPRAKLAVIVLVPTIVWFVVLQFGPIVEAMWFAFFHVDLTNMSLWDALWNSPFDGLLRFQHLFDPELNPEFWPGALHSAIWTVLQFLFVIPLGLLLSLAMAKVGRGRRFYQIAIFVPVVTPLVAIGLMMGKVFDPEAGPANGLLRALGLPTSAWFHDPTIALPLAAAIGAWRWMGLYVLILTAGILNIPRDIDEAAQVDGAGAWRRFWKVTLPLLGHVLALVMVLLLVNSAQEYTLPYTLGGGVQQAQLTYGASPDYGNKALVLLNLALFKQAFGGSFLTLGPASAGALLEFGVVLVVSVVLLRIFRPTWSY